MRTSTRWIRFNLVGLAGFVVQILALAATRSLGVDASVAVPVAVLVAVSHNFLWHERVTWPGQRREGRIQRWLSFNLSTGLISVVINVVVTTLMVVATGTPLLLANATAVVAASVVNFLVSDRCVFSRGRASAPVILRGPGVHARRLLVRGSTRQRARNSPVFRRSLSAHPLPAPRPGQS